MTSERDIVERLREAELWNRGRVDEAGDSMDSLADFFGEAAAEIARLRAPVDPPERVSERDPALVALRDARVKAGRSLRETAAFFGLTPVEYGEIERGVASVRREKMMETLAEAVAKKEEVDAVMGWGPKVERVSEASALRDDGVALIAAERARQVAAEGYTPEHDDEHVSGELAISAAAYAWPPNIIVQGVRRDAMWPFGSCDWKPGDRIRELSKAGALIAAEIDRVRRALEDTKGEG